MKPKIAAVLGMPRTGTTFLYHTLQQHSSLFLPFRKESYYFSINHGKGESWFTQLYDGMASNQLGLDIGPVYFLDPRSIPRLLDYDPDLRVILGIRDPVSYAFSQLNQIRAFGWEVSSAEDMVRGYDWPISEEEHLLIDLRDQFISKRILELAHTFQDRILFYDYRVMKSAPLELLKKIEDFLEIPPHFNEDNFENIPINASDRRNVAFLNYLLRNQKTLDFIYKVTPKSALRQARRFFDRASSKKKVAQERTPSDLVEKERLREFFSADIDFIERLFFDGSFATGADELPSIG